MRREERVRHAFDHAPPLSKRGPNAADNARAKSGHAPRRAAGA